MKPQGRARRSARPLAGWGYSAPMYVLLVLVAVIALALPLVAASTASADYREFTGLIDKVTKKGQLIVDNRMGDKVKFMRVDETVIEGEKTEWKKLKKKDRVTISWKMMDKPRKAYKIVVLPEKEEAGVDE